MIEFIKYLWDRLLDNPNLSNGFIEEKKPRLEDWIHDKTLNLGISKKILVAEGQWKEYRSEGEQQKRPSSAETMACTIYSCLKVICSILNRMKEMVKKGEADDEIKDIVKIAEDFELYDDTGKANLSEPYIAKLAGTSRRGNTFSRICDTIRKYGLVAEKRWPTPDRYTWNEYYKPIPQEVINRGRKLLEFIEINHEWVYPDRNNDSKKFSPNTTSVYAGENWNTSEVHPPTRQRHNHAVANDYYKLQKYDGIFDSYKPFDKKVSWFYGLGAGKIFSLHLKKNPINKVVEFLENFDGENIKHKDSPAIWFIQKAKKKLYPDYLTFLSYDGLKDGFYMINRNLIESIEDGDDMDVKKSKYWKFLKDIKQERQMDKLLEYLYGKQIN